MAEIETPDTPTPEQGSAEPATEPAGDDPSAALAAVAGEPEPAAAEPPPPAQPEPVVAEPQAAGADAESESVPAALEAAEAEPAALAAPEPDTVEIGPGAAAAAVSAAAGAVAEAESAEGADGDDGDDEAEGAAPVEDPPEVAALRQAREDGTAIEGKVIGWNKGGFHVALAYDLTAFCPNSEMELGRPRDPATYVDREFTFRVLKVQKRGRRIVLSRKAVLAGDRERLLAEMLPRLVPGATFEGRVTSITDFGAFVDVGGLEGLVHVSEISRRRVAHPSEALQLGAAVTVKVLKVEHAGERISLSMKAMEPDPWHGVAERFARGAEFDGTVVRKTDFGVFVELAPEIDGLIHLSRMPPGMTMEDPAVAIGTPVHGWIQEVDAKRKRISLSLREIPSDDPWKTVAERFPEGTAVEGTVESTSPFGAFINIEPGLTGLLPTSEMQVPRGTNPARLYSPGQKVHVLVAAVDTRRRRISLVREGAKIEGSRNDYQSFLKKQQKESREGLSAMASAFAKLKENR